MSRDVSRVRIKLPLQDTTGDGSNNVGSDVYLCVTSGFNWSGITRGSVEETCSETTEDDWGNIWKIFRGGRIIDAGTLTVTVDWDIDDEYGGREFVALVNSLNGDIVIEFPAGDGETAGPTITLTGHCTDFTPNGEILGEEDAARLTAEFVWKISGKPVFAAAT
jgi:hypothetical protein